MHAAVVPTAGRPATRTTARVRRACYGTQLPCVRDEAGKTASWRVGRSSAVADVLVLLKVAKMMLDVTKLLFNVIQRMYGDEMGVVRGQSGAVVGFGEVIVC